ncbi:putative B3 domain-containing protein At1g78640 [Telopea speciosissima]|uniref:putative B3 domain-containing protein At1g78640 n=1 Tax=Telopea speciosissima TaxID=54955 RepID=UPI001CC5160B|nr:putative B3 domain-containing protein At1g78640 [Telopea speciosissima]
MSSRPRPRPTIFYNFFEQQDPPQVVYRRVDQEGVGLETRDFIQEWPVKKILTSRDINYSQLVLPRDLVEDSILPKLYPEEQNMINRGQQLPITVRDLETLTEHQLKLWENGTSYVLTAGWTPSFVRRRALEIGEEIGLCWDDRLRLLRFSLITRPLAAPPVPPPPVAAAPPPPALEKMNK